MKKEYIAIYVGFGLFLVTFSIGFALYFFGFKAQSIIAAGISSMIFGLLLIIGIYSNIKNYGYFYSGVRAYDSNRDIKELDKIYNRTSKGSIRYSLIMWTSSIISILIFIFGLTVVLLHI